MIDIIDGVKIVATWTVLLAFVISGLAHLGNPIQFQQTIISYQSVALF